MKLRSLFKTSLTDAQKSVRNLNFSKGLQSSHTWSFDENVTPSPQAVIGKLKKLGGHHYLSIQKETSSRKYFGPTCPGSVMQDVDRRVIRPIQDFRLKIETMGAVVLFTHHQIESLRSQEDELVQNRSAATSPPYSVLEVMIAPYLTTINP